MQLLISNLKAEKRALNERLKEANIRKIEHAVKSATPICENTQEPPKSDGCEMLMNGVGILESMVGPLQKLVRNHRPATVYVTDLKGVDPGSQILLEKIRGTAAEAK